LTHKDLLSLAVQHLLPALLPRKFSFGHWGNEECAGGPISNSSGGRLFYLLWQQQQQLSTVDLSKRSPGSELEKPRTKYARLDSNATTLACSACQVCVKYDCESTRKKKKIYLLMHSKNKKTKKQKNKTKQNQAKPNKTIRGLRRSFGFILLSVVLACLHVFLA